MKRLILLIIVIVFHTLLFPGCTPSTSHHKNDALSASEWVPAYLGGGGFIVGLLQNPEDPSVMYARCDVAGVFKSEDRGQTWRTINQGMSRSYHHSVESFAISPHNPNVLFRCSGELRNHRSFGDIHKSTDGGESWKLVTDEPDYAGNGDNRMLGEMIQISPHDKNVVAAGAFSNGVYISKDEGETWKHAGLEGEPVGFLAFDPLKPERILVGTLDSIRYNTYLYPSQINKRPKVGRLYVTEDLGKTWTLLFERSKIEFGDIAFLADDAQTFLVSSLEKGIYKTTDGGKSFKKSMKGLPEEVRYNFITADPHRKNVFYTAPSRRGNHKHIPYVPIFRSKDAGETWELFREYEWENFSSYPKYINREEMIGWALSKVKVDVLDSNRMYMSNWYGVSVSSDYGKNWSGNYYKGMETICGENIIADPNNAGQIYFTMADHHPGISTDSGETYDQFAKKNNGHRHYPGSSAAVSSSHTPGLVIYGVVERETIDCAIKVSPDYGKTGELVKELKRGLFVQALREDPFDEGVFYAYIDGSLADGAGIYKSEDYGQTWDQMPFKWPEYIKTLPHRKNWVESELYSIVFNQVKNVCGTNQLMEVSPHQQGVIYLGEWTEGLWKTTDGGGSWQNISNGLPFHKNDTSTLNVIVVDKRNPGHLYAGFIYEGVWKSTNDGKTWSKIYPASDKPYNATSIAIGGKDEIIVASEPLYWAPSPSDVRYSRDGGQTWESIYAGEHGALRWKGIAFDNRNRRLHGVTAGNGVFYTDQLAH